MQRILNKIYKLLIFILFFIVNLSCRDTNYESEMEESMDEVNEIEIKEDPLTTIDATDLGEKFKDLFKDKLELEAIVDSLERLGQDHSRELKKLDSTIKVLSEGLEKYSLKYNIQEDSIQKLSNEIEKLQLLVTRPESQLPDINSESNNNENICYIEFEKYSDISFKGLTLEYDNPNYEIILKEVVDDLNSNKKSIVLISGFASGKIRDESSEEFRASLKLSRARADLIRKHFLQIGISKDRVITQWFGNLVCKENLKAEDLANNRVEIQVFYRVDINA